MDILRMIFAYRLPISLVIAVFVVQLMAASAIIAVHAKPAAQTAAAPAEMLASDR